MTTGATMPAEEPAEENGTGIVLEAVGGLYRVRLADGTEVQALLRGRVKRTVRTGDRVVPGDRVMTSRIGTEPGFVVEEVLPRTNELARAGSGPSKPKVVVANLDRCVVVLAAMDPPFREETADRFLAFSESAGIPPVLVLNKLDLPGARDAVREATGLYQRIGYQVVGSSVRTGEGMEALAQVVLSGISAFVGPSGVGKSTLLNVLDPSLELRTAAVGNRGGRGGKHTTVSARLLPLSSGGWVADTPGFSDLTVWGVDLRDISSAFPEFELPAQGCRFRGCSHIHEPDCGVKDALESGGIGPTRYQSYRSMREELAR
ncbi:MAG: ribosome small subunit-dependent GTPase A [Gemmatimonadetes bacterium]|nr:ribosome small subunit-dependent GTPase A [Gemmatimonadota bacterium]